MGRNEIFIENRIHKEDGLVRKDAVHTSIEKNNCSMCDTKLQIVRLPSDNKYLNKPFFFNVFLVLHFKNKFE